jgi:hypothetical protein
LCNGVAVLNVKGDGIVVRKFDKNLIISAKKLDCRVLLDPVMGEVVGVLKSLSSELELLLLDCDTLLLEDLILNGGYGVLWLDLNFKSGSIEFLHIDGYLYDDVLQGEFGTGLDVEIFKSFGTVLELRIAQVQKLLLGRNSNLVLDLLLDN